MICLCVTDELVMATLCNRNKWFIPGKLPHRHKIVIAGNHELLFDENYVNFEKKRLNPGYLKYIEEERDISSTKKLLTNCVYLQDSEVTVYGLRIYGSPW